MERILSIIMILLYKRTETVGSLAEQFEVSERTIYRDLAQLETAGLPLVSSVGRGGGIGLLPHYRLEKHLFSSTGLSLMCNTVAALGDMLDQPELEGDISLLSSLSETTWFSWSPELSPDSALKASLSKVINAITEEKTLKIQYENNQRQESSREIEPLRVVLRGRCWYLQARCRLRDQYRVFRLDRIAALEVTESSFNRQEQMTELPDLNFHDRVDRESIPGITLRVHEERVYKDFPIIRPYKPDDSSLPHDIRIPWPTDAWVEQLLCGMSEYIEVMEPAPLRQRIEEKLKKALLYY